MSLAGRTIAVSIGGAPDLGKLGLPAREVERALLTLCGAVVRAGGQVAYGGDFRPNGFTIQMYRHLAGAYADEQVEPFRHYLAETVLRRTRFDDLVLSLRESQSVARTVTFLGEERLSIRASAGSLLVGEGARRMRISSAAEFGDWLGTTVPSVPAVAFSRMRETQSRETDARVAMGGKMGLLARPEDLYEGDMPGIAEEAVLTLSAGKPFVALGAYGGATRDVAIALGLLDPAARTPRGEQIEGYDHAIARVAEFANRIPVECKADLEELALLERIETVAERSVRVIRTWLNLGVA